MHLSKFALLKLIKLCAQGQELGETHFAGLAKVYSVRFSKYALLTLTKTMCSGTIVEENALCWPCQSL